MNDRRLKPAAPTAAALVATLATVMCCCGCVKLGSEPPRRYTPHPSPPKQAPSPRSAAFPAFDALRNDLLKSAPGLSKSLGVFVIGIDVSGSAHASGVLEYTTKLLTDACRYMLCRGDVVILVPWDEAVRKDRITSFTVTDDDASLDALNKAFEDLENLVNPEHRGSNLLDARGCCLQEALKGPKVSPDGAYTPVVLIFTDIRVPDMAMKDVTFKPEQLKRMRRELTGSDAAEFEVRAYQAGQKTQIIVHSLVGKTEGEAASRLDRRRMPSAPVTTAIPEPPPPPRDTAGMRALLIVAAVLCLLAMIGLPFAWRHQVAIGDIKESVRAFAGRVMVQAGQGISPRGTVYLPVRGMEGQTLFTLEGKGPQMVAVARRGIRLNDGQTELPLPLGKPFSLRIAIDGVAGEQVLDVHVSEFFSTNAGSIIGMVVAFLLLVVCIVA